MRGIKMKMGRSIVSLTTVVLFAFIAFGSKSLFAAGGGEALFKTKCAMCHGADGAAGTPMGKNLKINDLGSAESQKLSDAEITDIITKGKNKMPAVGKALKPEEVKDLVAHVRSFKK